MSILKYLKVHTGNRYAISPRFSVNMKTEICECIPTPIQYSAPIQYKTQYRMELLVRQEFDATEANYDKAVRHAKRCILEHLYADALTMVRELRSAIYGCDLDRAQFILSDLEGAMTNVDEAQAKEEL